MDLLGSICGSSHGYTASPPAGPTQTGEAARRQGLRLPTLPQISAPARIKVGIARRGIEDKTKLGRHRWVVERTVSWLLRFERLGLRYDRTQLTLRPLLTSGRVLINLRRLVKQES